MSSALASKNHLSTALNPCIWILEDETSCQFVYQEMLGSKYQLSMADSLSQFEKFVESGNRPHLIIADLKLSDGSFLDYFLKINKNWILNIPFIVVTAADDLATVKSCFEVGALDYLTKPFGKAELQYRVDRLITNTLSAQLRRGRWANQTSETLTIDPLASKVRNSAGAEAQLTPIELRVLSFLLAANKRTASRREIIGGTWKNISVSSKTLDVHIFNIRKKLAPLNVNILFEPPNSYILVC